MENTNETKRAAETIKTELSKEDLLKYVELDLWSKFQERLWKLVGLFLTIVTVIGLLGIPYYIRNEVTGHLQQREKEFTDKTDQILAYSKLLAILRARYDSERYRFDGEVLRIAAALEEQQGNQISDNAPSLLSPGNELVSLISRADFAEVVGSSPIASRPLEVPENLKNVKLLPATIVTLERKGSALASGDKELHPIRNGTFHGLIKDLRYRIVVLEALRRSILSLEEGMVSLGGGTDLAKRLEVLRVNTLESRDFQGAFANELSSIAGNFLTKSEQAQFAQYQDLYTLGYKPNYAPGAPQATPTNTRSR
ncbi:MAG: hypothetical protein H7Z16_17310 [Pyrinomonadaceae bacterium]|nr:hypothetical protein [Pyrinomonadaceae bacterium]